MHTLLTRENLGYYADFEGMAPLTATLRDGWYYRGQYSRHRKRRYGNSPRGISPSHFVVCNQNHDQVGNRAEGERLCTLTSFEAQKLAAGVTLLSPFVPMLFMGEEYGETAPFLYFTSHGDPDLVEAVRRGRQEEFAAFGWTKHVPDPQDDRTFLRSKLNHALKTEEPHHTLLRFYQRLLRIRAGMELGMPGSRDVRELGDSALLLLRGTASHQIAMIFNFAYFPVVLNLPDLAGKWTTVIHSADASWMGPEHDLAATITLSGSRELRLSPTSFLVMEQTQSGTETK